VVDSSRSGAQGIPRRNFLGALSALQLSLCLPVAGETPHQHTIIVVFVSGVEAYLEAVSGLQEGLAKLDPAPVLIDLKSPKAAAELTAALRTMQERLVITVGTEALTTVASRGADAVVISTMILRSDRIRSSQAAPPIQRPAGVYLDVPLAGLLSKMGILLPGKNRFGLIRNSSHDEPDPLFPARVEQLGFTLHTVECSGPERLVKSFLSLKGKADFVVLLPDSSLYNSTTVRPLILASLESRLPLVGFSSSFVRAGAALGIYPDFRDVGSQTADVVQKLIAGKTSLADESPRKLQVAVNQRVARLLGLIYNETPELVIFR
jgi:putative tryptophan/tyrosine transport system substrate-binding protein